MAYKLTLIEYDEDIFVGEDMNPDISHRDYIPGVIGSPVITEEEQADVDFTEIATRIEDMRVYAKVISSSSSSSSSSSLSSSSSSSSSSAAGGYKFKDLGVTTRANGLYISPDGQHLLTIDRAWEYNWEWGILSYYLSVPWDIRTASFVAGVKFNSIPNGPSCQYYHGIYAHPDGYHIYILGSDSGYSTWVFDIEINTAWDITDNPTRAADGNYSVYPLNHRSLKFSSDGTKMYIAETFYDYVLQYNLSTAWDVTSGGPAANQYTNISSYDNELTGVCFKGDGTKMMVIGDQYDTVLYWTLSTAWTLYGETKDANEEDISDIVTDPNDIFCNSAGDHIFVVESNGYLYDFDFS